MRKIVKRIGQELAEEPELAPHIIQPLKFQGVMAMEENATVLAAKFMAKPAGEQFVIRREAYHRIKKAFEDAGIRFAHRAGDGGRAGGRRDPPRPRRPPALRQPRRPATPRRGRADAGVE